MKWFNTLSHNRWLEQETDRIFDFGKNSVVPTGFGWLGNKGQIKEEMGTHLWITARMLHVYSVAAAMGRPGAYSLVDHGIKAMNGALRDKKYGGWYACVNDEGVVDASKQGYQHFFALLGAASAVTTGHPEARKLLDYTIEIIEKYFWSEEEQMCLESWDEAFSKTEEYRGGNANMHAVEAFLIVYDVTHDKKWLDRAIRVASVIIHDVARNNHYRVNEHFDTQWNPLPDYNKDNPAHRFRAFGGTPGHWIEWVCLTPPCAMPGHPMARTGLFIPLTGKENRWSANVYVGLSSKQWVRPTRSTPSLAIASMKPGIKHGGSTALST